MTDSTCPFCAPAPDSVFLESELILGIWLGLACSLAVAAVSMLLRFAYLASAKH